jgi:hypothetical protein
MKPRLAEVDVAAPVVAWLRAGGWDVYQEVRNGKGGERSCDIVATRGPLVWVVEAKVRLNVEVLEQAHWWRQYAHYASVAVPSDACRGMGPAYAHLVGAWGLGVFRVRPKEFLYGNPAIDKLVDHDHQPHLNRRALAGRLRGWLHEEQKTFLAAGSPCGGGWTAFKDTCRNLKEVVQAHPGCTLKEAIGGRAPTLLDGGFAGIRYHYRTEATAISSLRAWIGEGKVPGVRLVPEERALRLYPADEAQNKS